MRRWPTIWTLGVAVPGAIACGLAAAHGTERPIFLDNVTSSMALGVYRRIDQAVAPGEVVAIRQPLTARAYLRTLGFPPDALLLKRVAAERGQIVCAKEDAAIIDGEIRLPRLRQDRLGRPLPAWSGCQRLGAGQVFLTGDNARSFDSRYFGPVSRRTIIGVYERVQ